MSGDPSQPEPPIPPDFPLWPLVQGQQVPRLGNSQSRGPWLRRWGGDGS